MEIDIYCNFGQVQEKKVKKVCDWNVLPEKVAANGSTGSSPSTTSHKPYVVNGECNDRSIGCASNDFSFPPGGVSSLRLPVVVVLNLIY